MKADFYLISSEGYGLAKPRACERVRRLSSETGDDLMLVRVTPPIPVRSSDGHEKPAHFLVLGSRHRGVSLFDSKPDWPIYVHVAVPKSPIDLEHGRVATTELENIAWAEVYEFQEGFYPDESSRET